MNASDDIDFFYILENHGWSTCYLSVEGQLYQLGPTHVFENPIEVLLDSLVSILEGANEVSFKWHDEPGEYNWLITRNPEQRHKVKISVTNCMHVGSSPPEFGTVDFEVKLKLFCVCVLRQMDKIRDLMSENSFKEHKEGEFPYPSFERFHQAYAREFS